MASLSPHGAAPRPPCVPIQTAPTWPMSVWSRANSATRACRAWLLLAGSLAACGHQDGIVGVQLLGDAGAAGAPAQPRPGFFDEFTKNEGVWEEQASLPGARTGFGQSRAEARDGWAAELRFPGHPEYA